MTSPAPASAELTRLLKEKALQLGFAKVGIIPAEPFQNGEDERLSAWLGQGFQADMAWMVTHYDKRRDPASLMDETRSILCVAMNYFTPDEYDPHDPQALKIAKYARGTDYHYVLKDRLKALLAYAEALCPGLQGRALTDSAPIMEKPLAVNAGLGWMGKNGNVILPGQGSFFFLGELLLNVALDYDATPMANHCGTCRRCIDACPTEAIVDEGVIDANRCISYWTIEYKGERFPAAIQDNLSGWIFGCDICQDVCPWNIKFAQPTVEPAFQPHPLNRKPQAEALLGLDEEAFRAQFQKSPLKRTKRAGLHRNIAMAAPHRQPVDEPT
ncbi:tRNA epoxyqueuosine(34) reductase QueG [Vampirovibrio sp.]|uniref:tRNA epoxyqueuosine(34) reductase QueG n=1 Tax=Vampirovibrio sp. TaxID=2717857 RepID=UPI00359423BC